MGIWLNGPIGLGAQTRITRSGCRTVLVMVPTLAAGTRLFDLVPLIEADHRIQLVFTVPHGTSGWHGLGDYLRDQRAFVVPWRQAVEHRFDLVLAASHRHLAEVRGPILLVPHGAGAMKSREYSRKAGGATVPSTGLERDLLTYRGRVLPSVLALTHDRELDELRNRCEEAVPAAIVAGDICWDRLVAGLPLRNAYRHALGVGDEELLVTISSTWSPDSVFGRLPGLYRKILDKAPESGARVAAVLHPQIWAAHGRRQVVGWLSDCIRRGLLLLPPEEGWRATVVASDWVVGDHGSTTTYAAGIGRPVSIAACPGDNIREGSLAALVRSFAPPFRPRRSLRRQFSDASLYRERLQMEVSAAISSRPGQAAGILRAAMYRLLALTVPTGEGPSAPFPLPEPIGG
ncbi:hypothetical protein ORV05_10820 [Amycolatopsis cynarae]|uniref:Uncharacterized protein n=1 Tax=Amycolatopsis cynarae TaxID=2995223 RepID=A0ABY7B7V5_9PSEU|nr:hypothetical protein [Amycolatopsis sp. HUAS 11-8]WAL68226.1 hypothetical protein ORV05_10820 [Amycolatopsis sp. HUAS 11-8]